MSEHPELVASHRAEIVAERRRMQAVVQSRVGRSIDGNGRVRLDNPDALGGLLPVPHGGTGHDQGALTAAQTRDLVEDLLAAGANITITRVGDTLTIAAAEAIGSAWSILTNGDPADPQLVWDSFGDVIMTEVAR